jgi:uncharacterized hydrophobic protein (TIGR00271 family)
MTKNPLDIFSLHYEKEEISTVIRGIDAGVSFRGTNLWILIFAIFVASLGLNVNSTAVIIGAMLISPLMGPIMGMGLGIGINDTALLRKSIINYVIATVVALSTSTLFFLLSPLNEAHSEILARTSPSIYDVLIALFGGFAGIIATASRQKGNVIPGVAIATALMPPLCTAGYGLATLQLNFFTGAFYLYIINTVFIGLATLVIVRILHFPFIRRENARSGRLARTIAWIVAFLTLIPSIYFGYDLVQRSRFEKDADRFIINEAQFSNDYLLNKKVNAQDKSITLVYGGKQIMAPEIDRLQKKLPAYNLAQASLNIKQGFSYLTENAEHPKSDELAQLTRAFEEKDRQQQALQMLSDSLSRQQELERQLFMELKAQYPSIRTGSLSKVTIRTDSTTTYPAYMVWLTAAGRISSSEKKKLQSWLRIRLHEDNIKLILQ